MNNRLKIISILFAATYLVVILHFVFTDMININIHKTNDNQEDSVKQEEAQSAEVKASLTYTFDILPIKESVSYPTISIENTKTGKPVDVEVRQFSVPLQKGDNSNILLVIGGLLMGVLKLFIVIYIPVQTFKIVKSISRNVIFDVKNIKRIRNLGYSLIILFFVMLLSQYIGSITVNDMVAFKDYKISYIRVENTSYLLFGFASLLFAEILKISLKMKEEQDLTV